MANRYTLKLIRRELDNFTRLTAAKEVGLADAIYVQYDLLEDFYIYLKNRVKELKRVKML